jgi:hypothetical protein
MRSMRMSLQAARIGASTPSFERHLVQAASHPIVFGAPYSVYVRAVRLALEEKGVPYELVPVDIFAPGGPSPEHRERHPFGKIPPSNTPGFACTRRGRLHAMSTRPSPGPGCNRKKSAVGPG